MSKLKLDLIRLLTRREYSESELRQKMLAKQYPLEAIDDEISSLKSQGLQSDQRFVDSMCAHYARSGKGPNYVMMQLQSKGIDKRLAQQSISQFDWQEALFVAKRKLTSVDGIKLKQRLYARGFTQSEINQGMNQEIEDEC